MSQHTIITPSGTFEYHLNRSARRRRTMEIHIRHEGVVEVHAPNSFSKSVVEGFLRRKAAWIVQKLTLFGSRQALLHQRSMNDAKECFYLGKSYPVNFEINQARWGRIFFDDKGWTIEVPHRIGDAERGNYARDFLEKWFKSHALSVLKERVTYYGHLMGDHPGAVKVRSPKSLWGSCHPAKRVLHFNWRIIMAPLTVIDYLVVHEMSHLKVADHSQRFWGRVLEFCPEYKIHQKWLKQNGYQLRLPFKA
jgi:predicted metal-dependent hydrolase